MSTYSLPELLKKWDRGELSLEQAIGHVLQHLLGVSKQLSELDKRLRQLEEPPKPQV